MRFTSLKNKKDERGVTIMIVGLLLFALIAMAALAIDVASLYVARGEAQRAADAAALGGAKAFVSSSFTSMPEGWTRAAICETTSSASNGLVNQQAALIASSNLIAGQPGVLQRVQCNFDDSNNNTNPRVTVTVQRTGAPTFFARIFNASIGPISATATAEAYNMSGSDAPPVQITGAKPWLIPNCNPYVIVPNAGPSPGNPNCPAGGGNRYDYFIDPVTGKIKNDTSFIGQPLNLIRTLSGAPGPDGSSIAGQGRTVQFYGLKFPAAGPFVCPAGSAVSCSVPTGNTYIDGMACAYQQPLRCGEQIGPSQAITAENTIEGGSPTSIGARCVIHASNDLDGQGQDEFSISGPPVTITGGDNNPNPGLRGITNISRSDSVITVPIDNGVAMCPGSSCTATTKVMGFMQIGIRWTTGGPDVPVVVLNAVGCKNSIVNGAFPPPNPVSSGTVSPVIVRLVQTP